MEKCSRHPWIMSEIQSRLKCRLSIYQMSLSKPFWKKIIPTLSISLSPIFLDYNLFFLFVPTLVIVWHTLTMNVSDWTAQILFKIVQAHCFCCWVDESLICVCLKTFWYQCFWICWWPIDFTGWVLFPLTKHDVSWYERGGVKRPWENIITTTNML